jgi:hypothetical protein
MQPAHTSKYLLLFIYSDEILPQKVCLRPKINDTKSYLTFSAYTKIPFLFSHAPMKIFSNSICTFFPFTHTLQAASGIFIPINVSHTLSSGPNTIPRKRFLEREAKPAPAQRGNNAPLRANILVSAHQYKTNGRANTTRHAILLVRAETAAKANIIIS